jgi:hypothetical protein
MIIAGTRDSGKCFYHKGFRFPKVERTLAGFRAMTNELSKLGRLLRLKV